MAIIKALYKLRIAYYNNKFGYSQVLFMGSVPRINHLLATVSWDLSPFMDYMDVSHIMNVNLFYWYNNQSKGVSIVPVNYLIR